METELRESQSTVNMLSQQMREGKEQSPMKEGELKGRIRRSFFIAVNKKLCVSEDMAKQQVADTELKARKILDEQRQAIVEQANYQFHLCDAKSESVVQNLKSQLRQQDVELYSRSQDSEKSRQEQYLLGAEL